jgi:hypothetical protein
LKIKFIVILLLMFGYIGSSNANNLKNSGNLGGVGIVLLIASKCKSCGIKVPTPMPRLKLSKTLSKYPIPYTTPVKRQN